MSSSKKKKRGGRDPQAKLQVEFFDISRRAAALREPGTSDKKLTGLAKMMADKKGDSMPLPPGKKQNMDESIKLYEEALALYRDKVTTKNPSYFAGAYQNVATAMMEARRYVEAEEYFEQAEKISLAAGLQNSQNHASILENMVVLHIKARNWEKAERAARDSLRHYPEDSAAAQKAGLKLLDKKARHAKLCTMVGKFQDAIELCSVVLDKSSNKKVRKSEMSLVQSIAKSELAILKRDKKLLQEAETQMSQSIGLAERAYSRKHSKTADHCEYCAMFQGAIRQDYNGAETMAMKAADCRQGHLETMMAEEIFARQKGAAEDKELNYIKVDIMQDDRCRFMMEECLAMLGNVHDRRFLRPAEYLKWKGF